MRHYGLTALLAVLLLGTTIPTASCAQNIDLSFDFAAPQPVAVAPPPLPVYVVPPPPEEGWVWTPGHWRWGGYDYFWVPGTWVEAPEYGMYWTPGYWGWNDGVFLWHEGYWGPHVGYYGGIAYGGGYDGHGFHGGEWHDHMYVPNHDFINVSFVSGASFFGGPGGSTIRPTPEQEAFEHEHHVPPTHDQINHAEMAAHNPALFAGNNHGRPNIAATGRPGDFAHDVQHAQRVGAPNPEARQHNAEVRQNPALAHGAAMPRQAAPQQQPHPQPAQHPEGQPRGTEGQPHLQPQMQPPHPVQPHPEPHVEHAAPPHPEEHHEEHREEPPHEEGEHHER